MNKYLLSASSLLSSLLIAMVFDDAVGLVGSETMRVKSLDSSFVSFLQRLKSNAAAQGVPGSAAPATVGAPAVAPAPAAVAADARRHRKRRCGASIQVYHSLSSAA